MQIKDQINSNKFRLKSLILKHHILYNGISFDKDLRIIKKAEYDQIKNGELDNVFARCLRYCRLHENRFLLHKLVYKLFSNVGISFENNGYFRILTWLLLDDKSELKHIVKIVERAFHDWKKIQFEYPIDWVLMFTKLQKF